MKPLVGEKEFRQGGNFVCLGHFCPKLLLQLAGHAGQFGAIGFDVQLGIVEFGDQQRGVKQINSVFRPFQRFHQRLLHVAHVKR